jgi:hypothetical protein
MRLNIWGKKTLDEPTININHTIINFTSAKVCTFLDLAFNSPSNQMIGKILNRPKKLIVISTKVLPTLHDINKTSKLP